MSTEDSQKPDSARQAIDKANSRQLMKNFKAFKYLEGQIDKVRRESVNAQPIHRGVLETFHKDLEPVRDVLRDEARTIAAIAEEYGGDGAKTLQTIDAAKRACTELIHLIDTLLLNNPRAAYIQQDQTTSETVVRVRTLLEPLAEMISLYWEITDRTQDSWS